MSFLTFDFLIFVLVLLIAYYAHSGKNQWLLLLGGSLVFYCFASPYYLVFLFFSIGTAYCAAVSIGKLDEQFETFKKNSSSKEEVKSYKQLNNNKKKCVLTVTLIVNIAILAVLKYTGFFMETIASLVSIFGVSMAVPKINFILPLGISYYTFMTISYLLDVYWGAVAPQQNFFKYALYILYFPHITQGPIDTYSDISDDLYKSHAFDFVNIKEGAYRVIRGLFKKLVIAGRLAVYVDAVYGKPESYGSLTLLCATFFYAIQMYCDFSGYMDMAVGVSRMFGINITENFDLPYFSKSIPEYWRRWHITLGTWFRSYVFYPVIRSSFCKKLSNRLKKNHDKAIASMVTTIVGLACVWVLTGLWHGASWHYVMHGVYHGTIIIISTILAGSYKKWKLALHISEESKVWHVFQIIRTFIIVDISYILFRATSLKDAFYCVKQIFGHMSINGAAIKAAILPFTEDNTAVAYGGVVMVAIFMLFIVECFEYNGRTFFAKHRYMVTAVMIIMTALFGVFGQSSFLYAAY